MALAAVAQPTYEISGQVVHAVTGAPVAKATVWASDSTSEQVRLASMVTGPDGRFRLTGLRAGKYGLIAERLGFLHQHYGAKGLAHRYASAIVVGPNAAAEDLRFRLWPSSVIHGYVRDRSGEPAAGLSVTAMLVTGSGMRRHAATLARAGTDDRGYFRLHSLPAGTFVVAAEGQLSWELRDSLHERKETYATAYHPDATEGGAAAEIKVGAGEEARADITVRIVPAVEVRMKLQLPPEGGNAYAYLTAAGPFGSETSSGGRVAVTNGAANFGLRAVGRYRLHVVQGEALVMDREVEVREGDAGMEVPFVPMARVRAQVTIHGGSEIEAGRMVLALVPEGTPHAFNRAVEPDGSAVLPAVSAGRYQIRLSAPQDVAIRTVEARGALFQKGILEIPETGEVGLSLIADGAAASQPGTVYRDGRPAAGMLVLLVPKDRLPEVSAYRFDQSDSDGTFTWHGVPSGEYWAVVLEEGLYQDYQDPSAVEPLLPGAKLVKVGEGKREPVRLDFVPLKKTQ